MTTLEQMRKLYQDMLLVVGVTDDQERQRLTLNPRASFKAPSCPGYLYFPLTDHVEQEGAPPDNEMEAQMWNDMLRSFDDSLSDEDDGDYT